MSYNLLAHAAKAGSNKPKIIIASTIGPNTKPIIQQSVTNNINHQYSDLRLFH